MLPLLTYIDELFEGRILCQTFVRGHGDVVVAEIRMIGFQHGELDQSRYVSNKLKRWNLYFHTQDWNTSDII